MGHKAKHFFNDFDAWINHVNVYKYMVTMLSSSFVQRIIQAMVYNKSAVISSLVKLLRHIQHYLLILPCKIKTPLTVHLVYIENLKSAIMPICNQQNVENSFNKHMQPLRKSTKYVQFYIYSLFGETHGKKFSCFDYPTVNVFRHIACFSSSLNYTAKTLCHIFFFLESF